MDGFILAGGKSRRMGINKALLDAGGVPVIRRVAEAMAPVSDRVTLVTAAPGEYGFLGLKIVEDMIPGLGPLGGIYTALRTATTGRCLVLACDLPMIKPQLLQRLIAETPGYEAVVPRTADQCHPLCAVYADSGLGALEAQVRDGDYRVMNFLVRVRTRWIDPQVWSETDPEGLSFVNVNTPEVYRMVCQKMGWAKREG